MQFFCRKFEKFGLILQEGWVYYGTSNPTIIFLVLLKINKGEVSSHLIGHCLHLECLATDYRKELLVCCSHISQVKDTLSQADLWGRVSTKVSISCGFYFWKIFCQNHMLATSTRPRILSSPYEECWICLCLLSITMNQCIGRSNRGPSRYKDYSMQLSGKIICWCTPLLGLASPPQFWEILDPPLQWL